MDTNDALAVLAALSQITRLETFRLLVAHEPEGLAAGEVSSSLKVPHNTLSSHLAALVRAGLVGSERRGRSIVYRADLARLQALTLFLVRDCCQGRPELCAPAIADLLSVCRPSRGLSSETV